jgi:hypothetical protein
MQGKSFHYTILFSLGLQNMRFIMTFKKTIFFFILFGFSFIASSQSADEVINKYIAYIGGMQKWKSVKTITSTGTYNYGGMEFPFTSYSKAPDRYKYIVAAHGKSFTQAYDGNQGWRIDGFKDEKKKTILKGRKQARAMANEADVELESPFINYREKGHTILMEGMDTIGNKTCYQIRLMQKNGDSATFFFDNKDFALVKKQAVAKNWELDNAMLDIVYSDYRLTSGIRMPHKITCSSNGQDILIIAVKSVKLNLPMADSIFKP